MTRSGCSPEVSDPLGFRENVQWKARKCYLSPCSSLAAFGMRLLGYPAAFKVSARHPQIQATFGDIALGHERIAAHLEFRVDKVTQHKATGFASAPRTVERTIAAPRIPNKSCVPLFSAPTGAATALNETDNARAAAADFL